MIFGKSIGHPDLPVIPVIGEALWLAADAQGDARTRRRVLNRETISDVLLTEQHGPNYRPRGKRPK